MGKSKKKKPATDFSDTPLAEQFQRDAMIMQDYANRGDKKTPAQEIFLRAMLMISQKNDVQFRNDANGPYASMAARNDEMADQQAQYNWAALLGHGGRVVITLSEDEMEEVINWLLTGKADRAVNIISRDAAIKNGQGYYERDFASHGFDKNGEEKKLEFNVFDMGAFKSNKDHRHFGVDLGFKGPDGNGPEDGSHGHMFIHVDPGKPPQKRPSLMIGIENSAPRMKDVHGGKHTVDSKAKKVSATGGAKSKEFPESYPIRPHDIGGKKITLDSKDVRELKTKHASDFATSKLSQAVSSKPPTQQLNAKPTDTEEKTGNQPVNSIGVINRNLVRQRREDNAPLPITLEEQKKLREQEILHLSHLQTSTKVHERRAGTWVHGRLSKSPETNTATMELNETKVSEAKPEMEPEDQTERKSAIWEKGSVSESIQEEKKDEPALLKENEKVDVTNAKNRVSMDTETKSLTSEPVAQQTTTRWRSGKISS